MEKKIFYEATNLQQGCDARNCFGCPYLDHGTGHCSAAEEKNDCEYCSNAFTDKRLNGDNDLHYISIGRFECGFGVFIRASATCRPPVAVIVQQYCKDLKRNVDVACYAPTYCPICGRKITENESYLKTEKEKSKGASGG